ncbi:L-threonylcarbamoyladenylate synthase [Chondromyces crocatus]|uniref:Threonylcarbamoyl-AMP synthase n=1 Tax=Chondromyces crocatus TaxID=52 RepID=A0A0K1EPL3_CHOCO|nr:L-threonylcarbamoyladenylate synthase [Chondromyces crocatus]AKT42796.1 translation factor Sua5 [Chondromyces crocatus]
MRTERLATDPASISRAAALLRAGGLVAFPTETVYGLGARADDGTAAARIFEAKGRPSGNPLIVHVPDAAAAQALVETWPPVADRLAAAFWPGPLTMIFARRADRIADVVTACGPTVAVRVPAHPVARALLQAVALPIAAPSANRSTEISPTTAEHVWKALAGRIDALLDSGPCERGIESTILDVTTSPPTLLRPGSIPAHAIAAIVPLRDRSGAIVAPHLRASAPGSHARHYAPRTRVLLTHPEQVRATVDALVAQGLRTATLEHGRTTEAGAHAELLPSDPVAYGAELYAALHRLQDSACDVLVIADVPEEPGWEAIRDRLRRASAPSDENP